MSLQQSSGVLEMTRTFDAPRELVFAAWTEAEHLAQWWGSPGVPIRVEKLDLRPSGIFLYSSEMPDGGVLYGKFTYREIEPPERLVYVSAFSDAEGNTIRAPFGENWPLEILGTVTFTEEDGKTTIHTRSEPLDPSDAERETFASATEMVAQGLEATYKQLDSYLERIRG